MTQIGLAGVNNVTIMTQFGERRSPLKGGTAQRYKAVLRGSLAVLLQIVAEPASYPSHHVPAMNARRIRRCDLPRH